jgi:hypothetical protein
MNDARNVAEDRQKNIEPELPSKAHREEYPDRRQKDREEDTDKVAHRGRGASRKGMARIQHLTQDGSKHWQAGGTRRSISQTCRLLRVKYQIAAAITMTSRITHH